MQAKLRETNMMQTTSNNGVYFNFGTIDFWREIIIQCKSLTASANLKLRLLLIEKAVNESRFLKESRSLKFVAHVSMTKRVFHFPKKDRKNCLNLY